MFFRSLANEAEGLVVGTALQVINFLYGSFVEQIAANSVECVRRIGYYSPVCQNFHNFADLSRLRIIRIKLKDHAKNASPK